MNANSKINMEDLYHYICHRTVRIVRYLPDTTNKDAHSISSSCSGCVVQLPGSLLPNNILSMHKYPVDVESGADGRALDIQVWRADASWLSAPPMLNVDHDSNLCCLPRMGNPPSQIYVDMNGLVIHAYTEEFVALGTEVFFAGYVSFNETYPSVHRGYISYVNKREGWFSIDRSVPAGMHGGPIVCIHNGRTVIIGVLNCERSSLGAGLGVARKHRMIDGEKTQRAIENMTLYPIQ